MHRPTAPPRRAWSVLVPAIGGYTLVLALLRFPYPVMFGALLAGLTYALVTSEELVVAPSLVVASQAVVGVAIGADTDRGTLAALEAAWLPVVLVCLGTLAVSVGFGLLLRLRPEIDAPTGVFAMIAGGASGVVAIAHDLGADERIVAVVQYLRILMIILVMPAVTSGLLGEPEGDPVPLLAPDAHWTADVAFTVVACTVGLLLARYVRIPAHHLLVPLLVSLGLAQLPVLAGARVPAVVQFVCFGIITLQVGLRFTPAILREVVRLLPLFVAAITGLIVVSAGFGVLLADATGRSAVDGYLATTPGGLYAVLAAAVARGADASFILAVQMLRLVVMLLGAPLLARLLARYTRRDPDGAAPAG